MPRRVPALLLNTSGSSGRTRGAKLRAPVVVEGDADELPQELRDALCLAVSLVTGPMIRETVQIARAAKELYPNLPVVLGG